MANMTEEELSKKVEKLETELISLRIKIARIEDYLEDIPTFRDYVAIEELSKDDEPLYEQALELIKKSNNASASMLQRRLSIGYARAGRLITILEQEGVIGPANGMEPRKVIST